MATQFTNLERETKTPYEILRFDMSSSAHLEGRVSAGDEADDSLDFVDVLDQIQKDNYRTRLQAYVGRLMDGQFVIASGDYGIWALGSQKGNRIELMVREKDEPTFDYIRNNTHLDI